MPDSGPTRGQHVSLQQGFRSMAAVTPWPCRVLFLVCCAEGRWGDWKWYHWSVWGGWTEEVVLRSLAQLGPLVCALESPSPTPLSVFQDYSIDEEAAFQAALALSLSEN